MQLPIATIAAVSLALAATTARRPAAEPTAEALITLTPTARGCDITVRAHNKGSANVTIDLEDSEVKVKNGLWSKFNQGGNWVVNTGGDHESTVIALDLGCSFERQYKFLMRSGGNEKYIYFPDPGQFTTSVSLGLANVGRHF
ncbi:MAG: hypothetical protein AB7L66_16145 [Gemmatimonadales bacterium]